MHKCYGKKCKYFKNDLRDAPGYCGLISIINNIFKIVNLPKMENIFYYSNFISNCPFYIDICDEGGLKE